MTEATSRRVADAVIQRTRNIVESLSGLDDDELQGPSGLPEWSRLTIACHLRFGAGTLSRMTRSALQGVPVAYYPEGREVQRGGTLVPLAGESPQDVVNSLARLSEELTTHGPRSDLVPGAESSSSLRTIRISARSRSGASRS